MKKLADCKKVVSKLFFLLKFGMVFFDNMVKA